MTYEKKRQSSIKKENTQWKRETARVTRTAHKANRGNNSQPKKNDGSYDKRCSKWGKPGPLHVTSKSRKRTTSKRRRRSKDWTSDLSFGQIIFGGGAIWLFLLAL